MELKHYFNFVDTLSDGGVFSSNLQLQFANYDGSRISLHPLKNGNCHFESVVDQLHLNSNSALLNLKQMPVSALTGNNVREKIIQYMKKFSNKFKRFHCTNNWTDYLNDKQKPTTFGDHLTLYICCMSSFQYNIFSFGCYR